LTSWGSALPWVFFMTWPTREFVLPALPARTSATGPESSAITFSTMASSAPVSVITVRPLARTMSPGAFPVGAREVGVVRHVVR